MFTLSLGLRGLLFVLICTEIFCLIEDSSPALLSAVKKNRKTVQNAALKQKLNT